MAVEIGDVATFGVLVLLPVSTSGVWVLEGKACSLMNAVSTGGDSPTVLARSVGSIFSLSLSMVFGGTGCHNRVFCQIEH